MTKPTRYDSCYAELIATLKRNPGKTSFPMRRELLEGLAHEMAKVAYELRSAQMLRLLPAEAEKLQTMCKHSSGCTSDTCAKCWLERWLNERGLGQCGEVNTANPVPPGGTPAAGGGGPQDARGQR